MTFLLSFDMQHFGDDKNNKRCYTPVVGNFDFEFIFEN